MSTSALERRSGSNASAPLIAVIVPIFKQSQYLKDAVISAMRQSIRNRIKVIIVSDGCPHADTDFYGRYFQDAWPGSVYYLKKENGGVSAARNLAIRFALDSWPSVKAIFPLDSDNKLKPGALEKLYKKLMACSSDVGWIYTDLVQFGCDETLWRTHLPFSLYRLAHENFCDNGSLLRRDVFDAGVWYDEAMLGGYEDWEFFIHAARKGFRAVHMPDAGFLYRRHGHSRNEGAKAKHEALCNYMRSKHNKLFGSSELTAIEHREMPRFAIVDVSTKKVRLVTDPLARENSGIPLARFIDQILANIEQAGRTYLPPITLFADKRAFSLLHDLRVLPGLLLAGQKILRWSDHFAITLEMADNPHLLQITSLPEAGRVAAFAMTTRRLIELGYAGWRDVAALVDKDRSSCPATLRLQVGASYLSRDRRALPVGLSGNGVVPGSGSRVGRVASEFLDRLIDRLHGSDAVKSRAERPSLFDHTEFAFWKHVDPGATTFPRSIPRNGAAERNVFLITAWIGLGGLDQIVLNFAFEMAKLRTNWKVHLVCTHGMHVEADPRRLQFDTITFLPTDPSEKMKTLGEILQGADVIINAHSMQGYELLPDLGKKAHYISLLQVIDLDERGHPAGYPMIAARHYNNLIDTFLIPSRQLKRALMNLGVPGEKIAVVPNAPVVFPPTVEEALSMTRARFGRPFSTKNPVRMLFSGRFDYQKGFDRLKGIVTRLHDAGIPLQFTVIGKPVLSNPEKWMSIPGAKFLPATMDRDILASYYENADVFLLPSRFEGVPLAILEAMTFGNIVVTTDVGASNEVVKHERNGFLVDPHLPEDNIADTICEIIAGIAADGPRYDEMRLAACRTGMDVLWPKAAEMLCELIEAK